MLTYALDGASYKVRQLHSISSYTCAYVNQSQNQKCNISKTNTCEKNTNLKYMHVNFRILYTTSNMI
jgi:hypothetical protein